MKEREHEKDQFEHSLSPLVSARVMNGKFWFQSTNYI